MGRARRPWAAVKGRAAAPDETLAALWPGEGVALLKALHILTRDGRLNQDSRRKLKQVRHLAQLIAPMLERLLAAPGDPVIADLGAGKAYLGLLLYDLHLRGAGRGTLVAVEARAPLAETVRRLAREQGFDRVRVDAAPIEAAEPPEGLGLVTALHACDTATDDAIRYALRGGARFIALVPCCQAELAARLAPHMRHPLAQLWRHPLHRREFAAGTTNVLRALYLEAEGYRVRVTEFTGFEHTQKNEAILAERIQRRNGQAAAALAGLLAQLPARPALLDAWPPPGGPASAEG